jgi:hypothetical protein
VHFKNAPRKDLNSGGDKPKEYFLNEQQTTFFQMREQQQNKPLSFEKLAKEPSFGVLRKTRISHIKGKTTENYILNKKQAIAVWAVDGVIA